MSDIGWIGNQGRLLDSGEISSMVAYITCCGMSKNAGAEVLRSSFAYMHQNFLTNFRRRLGCDQGYLTSFYLENSGSLTTRQVLENWLKHWLVVWPI